MNDPNGLAHVDDRYHVFFQYNPAGPVHAGIHWGHCSSTDLVSWQQEPVALTPTPGGPDAYGCWTGTIAEVDRVPTVYYSGVTDASPRAVVLRATSDRTLRTWTKCAQVVAGVPDDPEVTAVRDPFLLRLDGRTWAVQGAGLAGGDAAILAYSCEDPAEWTYRGPVASTGDRVAATVAAGRVWECPQLFPLGDRWVLVVSPLADGPGPELLVPQQVQAMVGDLRVVGPGLRFEAESGNALDVGPDFYAPQVLVQDDRVLMWGWAWEHDRSVAQVQAAGWAGVLTYPREVFLRDDVVCSRPAPELQRLRQDLVQPDRSSLLPAGLNAFEVTGGEGELVLTGPGREDVVAELLAGTRVLVDASIVECFASSGVSRTSRWYPGPSDRWELRGGSPTVWRLGLAPQG